MTYKVTEDPLNICLNFKKKSRVKADLRGARADASLKNSTPWQPKAAIYTIVREEHAPKQRNFFDQNFPKIPESNFLAYFFLFCTLCFFLKFLFSKN